MSFQRLFPTFLIPHFGHAVALAKVVAYALTRIKSGLLDGTVPAWQINEGTGTVVGDAVGVNNGTIYGAIWTTTAKSGGYALDFDGVDDRVEIPDHPSLDLTTEVTIEVWCKIASQPVGRFIATKGIGDARSYCLGILRSDDPTWPDKGEFGIYDGTTWYPIRSVKTVGDNVWHHVVGTYDGNELKLYIDGALDVSEVIGAVSIQVTTIPFSLGAAYDGTTWANFADGIIDSVFLYNRALTATEVSDRYNYGLKIRVTNLLEGQKVELYDTADVLKASYTVGVGETEAILDVSALTFPFEGYFKIYDTDGVTLLLQTGIYTDIWGGDVYKFTTA